MRIGIMMHTPTVMLPNLRGMWALVEITKSHKNLVYTVNTNMPRLATSIRDKTRSLTALKSMI